MVLSGSVIQEDQLAVIVADALIQSDVVSVPATTTGPKFGFQHPAILDESHIPCTGTEIATSNPSKVSMLVGQTVIQRQRRQLVLTVDIGARGDQVIVPVKGDAVGRSGEIAAHGRRPSWWLWLWMWLLLVLLVLMHSVSTGTRGRGGSCPAMLLLLFLLIVRGTAA